MAVMTAVEAAKTHQNPLASGYIELLAMSSNFYRILPFLTVQGDAYTYNERGAYGSVAFRTIGGSYTPSNGVLNPITESMCILGGEIDVDIATVRAHGPERRAIEEQLKIEGLARKFDLELLKGDTASTTAASNYTFDGLQVRCTGGQLISEGSTDGGDALQLASLDALIDAVECPGQKYLVMNRTIKRLLSAAARSSSVGGYITYAPDEFGRSVMRYNDVPILTAYTDNTDSEILPITETGSGGSTATCTSVYCFSVGPQAMFAFQAGPLEAMDLGIAQESPVYRTRIEHQFGIVVPTKAAARLYGVKNAAVTA